MVLQIAGAVLVAAALAQVAVLFVSSLRRAAFEGERRLESLEFLRHRARSALAHSRDERQRVELSWNGFRKFQVAKKDRESADVHSFYLTPHDGKPLPPFHPGQFLTFQLKIPDQPKPVIRCYSLSDSPNHPDRYRVSIKRVQPPRETPDAPPGLSSSFFNDSLREGDILDVKAPSGHFYLDPGKDSAAVLIGGGIGITPVLSMLNTICESDSKRETWFFLGVNNHADHIMKDHLEQLNWEHDNLHLHVCYAHPGEDDVEGKDYQHEGWVGVDLFRKVLPSNNCEFFVCGPPPLMDSVTTGLKEWGVPDEHINFEAFGPATVKKKRSQVEPSAAGEIEVSFARAGKTLKWDSAAESLLDFAEDNGIVIDSGCRAGNCGTCITAIKSGEVSYINEPGEPPEAGSCLTCVAVPKANLTLDA